MKFCSGCMEKYADDLQICPHCGYVMGTKPENALHMMPGSVLANRYLVGKVIGYGGFGVTYIGWDSVLETKVAIKEYLPSEFSTRVLGQTMVTVFSGDKQEQFNDGMKRFIEEAKKLAKFHSTPGIVKIFDSFEYNNTAYIIMELLEGETLAEKLKRGETFSEDQAVEMMTPVIKSLEKVHQDGIIHRDISPDNIFITNSGSVKLIDFGAARYATTTHSRSLTVIIKPGFSPEEQYRSRGDQGAYTDVYALAATMYRMITGQTPPDALERRAFYENKKKDMLEPLRKYRKNIDEDKENAILNALNIRIEDRTPDMQTFMHELTTDEPVARRAGTIQKLDVLKWPLWAKITLPSMAALVILFAVLFGLGIINFETVLNGEISIPEGYTRVKSVINMDYDNAKAMLINDNLDVEIEGKERSDKIAANIIMSQDTQIGSIVPENTHIKVILSSGQPLQMVPNVLGTDYESAKSKLEELGFSVEKNEVYDSVIAKDCVVAQSTPAFNEIEDESTITLTVSKGVDPSETKEIKDVDIPEFVGLTYEEAIAEAEKQGLTLKVSSYEYSKDNPRDTVISQSKNANEQISNDQTIELVVSLGYEKVKVPDVTVLTQEEAERYLKARGLKYEFSRAEDDNVPVDHVISHDPEANSEVDPETVVKVVICSGKKAFPMPKLVGLTEEEATKILNENGLPFTKSLEENNNKPEGEVLKQSINVGEDVHKGDEIVITVCTHSQVIKVPDVTGKTQSEAEKIIKNAGLKVSINKMNSDTVAKGNVISQTPKAGSGLKKNDTVILNVSDGKAAGTTSSATSSTSGNDDTRNNDEDSKPQNDNNNNNNNNSSRNGTTSTTSTVAKPVEPTSIQLNKKSITLSVGNSEKLVANLNPSNAESTITWESLVPSIASVDQNGVVTGKSVGITKIRVSTSNGMYTTCDVTVQSDKVQPSSITLNRDKLSLKEGDEEQLSVSFNPSNTTETKLSWSSDKPSVATVDSNGLVKGISAGTAVITVKTSNNKTASCTVTVESKKIYPTDINLSKSSLNLYIGRTERLSVSFSPSNATEKEVSWDSGDESIATVNQSGDVTAVSPGKTNIIVKCNNITKTCEVNVLMEDNSSLVSSGECGSSVSWQLFNTGNMYVFGSGSMSDGTISAASNAQTVIVDNGVTYIGASAFRDYSNLTKVTLPDSLDTIGDGGFYNCYNLNSVSLGSGVRIIGENAFCHCGALTSIDIPDTVTDIGKKAFENCSSLTSVYISGEESQLRQINESAFSNCVGISEINIPKDVNYIGSKAFNNCSSLRKVNFYCNKPDFSKDVFSNCTDVVIYYDRNNDSMENIDEDGFEGDVRYEVTDL